MLTLKSLHSFYKALTSLTLLSLLWFPTMSWGQDSHCRFTQNPEACRTSVAITESLPYASAGTAAAGSAAALMAVYGQRQLGEEKVYHHELYRALTSNEAQNLVDDMPDNGRLYVTFTLSKEEYRRKLLTETRARLITMQQQIRNETDPEKKAKLIRSFNIERNAYKKLRFRPLDHFTPPPQHIQINLDHDAAEASEFIKDQQRRGSIIWSISRKKVERDTRGVRGRIKAGKAGAVLGFVTAGSAATASAVEHNTQGISMAAGSGFHVDMADFSDQDFNIAP